MSRRFPAHGSCFHGFPITIHVNHESAKTEFEVQVGLLVFSERFPICPYFLHSTVAFGTRCTQYLL